MIDKFFYKFFGAIDNIFEKICNWFTAPRCKCKIKGKVKKEVILEVDKTFENEIKKWETQNRLKVF